MADTDAMDADVLTGAGSLANSRQNLISNSTRQRY
jgi:hypothetical protein